eukprot:COSAG01_NODE_8763_length_2667_cov_9.123442_3_plen_123_part_00
MDGFTTVLAGVTRLRLQYTLYFRNPSIRPYIFLQKYICTDIGYIETLWISMQPRFGHPSMDVWTDFSKYAFNRPLSRVTPAESAIVAVHTLFNDAASVRFDGEPRLCYNGGLGCSLGSCVHI